MKGTVRHRRRNGQLQRELTRAIAMLKELFLFRKPFKKYSNHIYITKRKRYIKYNIDKSLLNRELRISAREYGASGEEEHRQRKKVQNMNHVNQQREKKGETEI